MLSAERKERVNRVREAHEDVVNGRAKWGTLWRGVGGQEKKVKGMDEGKNRGYLGRPSSTPKRSNKSLSFIEGVHQKTISWQNQPGHGTSDL